MRVCEGPGCERSMEGRRPEAKFCGDKCRAAAWKARTGYGRRDFRPCPSCGADLSQSGDVHAPDCQEWSASLRRARANGRRKPSGLQVSYHKAVAILERRFSYWFEQPRARALAEDLMREALSDRQRQQLKERAS